MYRSLALTIALVCCGLPASSLLASPAEDRYRQVVSLSADAPERARAEVEAWQRELGDGGDPEQRAALHRSRAALHRRAGQHDQAAVELSLAVAVLDPGSPQRALAQTELAISYAMAGLYSETLPLLRSALQRFEDDQDWRRASAVLVNLGNSLDAAGDTRAAREHYERALALKREHGITKGVAGLLNNLATLEIAAGRPEAALAGLREAVTLAAAEGEAVSQALAMANLVETLASLGEFSEAESLLDTLDQLPASAQPQRRAARHKAEAVLRRSQATGLSAGEAAQALQAAAAALDQALEQAAQIDEPHRRAALLRLGSEIDAERGQLEQALARRIEAEREQAEHEARLQRDRLAVLAARYEQASQTSQLADLRARDARQQSLLLLLALTVGAVLGGGVWLWRRSASRRVAQRELEAHNQTLSSALRRAELERQRAEDLAERHARLLQRVGDDLRAPLLRMRGSAERLLVAATDPVVLRRELAGIAEASSALIRTSEQMIESPGDTPRHSAGAPQVELGELLEGLVNRQQSSAGLLPLQLELADGPCRVTVEAARLQLLLLELLQLAERLYRRGPALRLKVECGGGTARLLLDDPERALERCLQRADTVQDSGDESSLGLLWIQRTIDTLGARLDFDGPPLHPLPRLVLQLPAAD